MAGSLFEPNEKKPDWALTPAEFTKLSCEECGKPFVKDAANGVSGGLMIMFDDDAPGGRRFFHGYPDQTHSCYGRAERKLLEELGQ